MRTNWLIACVVASVLALGLLLAWPDREVRESLSGISTDNPRIAEIEAPSLERPAAFDIEGTDPELKEHSRIAQQPVVIEAATKPDSQTVRRRIRARLVDSAGRPIAHGKLRFIERPEFATSREDGKVTLEFETPTSWVPRHNRIALLAEADSYASLSHKTALGDDLETWLGDLTLQAPVLVTGIVVDETGAPVAGAIVVASPEVVSADEGYQESARQYGPRRLGDHEFGSDADPFTAITDLEGRFVIDDFFAPWATVYARHGTGLWTVSNTISMVPGQAPVEVELVLTAPEDRVWIRGRVQNSEGKSVSGAKLRLTEVVPEGRSPQLHKVSGPDGRFGFPVKAGTTWNLFATPVAWERDCVYRDNIAADSENLVIVLPDTEWFWAKVADEEGVALTEGQVFGVNTGFYEKYETLAKVPRVISDLWDDGRARLRITDLPLYLAAQVPGFEVQVLGPFPPQWSETVHFSLKRKPMIRGTVFAEGRTVEGAQISLHACAPAGEELVTIHWKGEGSPFTYDASYRFESEVRSDQSGRFEIAYPEPSNNARMDRWVLRARSASLASVELGPFTLEELQELNALDLTLTQGGSIRGRLELPDSERVFGWTIVAMSDSGESVTRVLDEEDSFLFEHLRPGPWQLRAVAPGKLSWLGSARLQPKRARENRIQVKEGRSAHSKITVEFKVPIILRGKLTFQGIEPRPWRGHLHLPDKDFEMIEIDATGQFEVEVGEAGEWTLWLGPKDWSAKLFEIADSLFLQPGTTAWEHEFELGTVHLQVAGSAPPEPFPRRALLHQGEGNLRVIAQIDYEADGEYEPRLFPIGENQLIDVGRAWNLEPRDPSFIGRRFEFGDDGSVVVTLHR